MAELEKEIKEIGVGSVATIMPGQITPWTEITLGTESKRLTKLWLTASIQETDAVTAVKNSYANDDLQTNLLFRLLLTERYD